MRHAKEKEQDAEERVLLSILILKLSEVEMTSLSFIFVACSLIFYYLLIR